MIKVRLIMENINLYVQVLENISPCLQPFFLRIIYYLKIILQIIRFVIPILLIFKMGLTFYKGLINPSEKAPIKNVTGKIIACVIVFLVPTLIKLIMALIEQIIGVNYYNGVTECYTFANMEYIKILEQNQLDEAMNTYLTEREQALNDYEKMKLALERVAQSNKQINSVGEYANNKNMIKCGTGSQYNTGLYNNVRTAGYKTREGVVAAALYLSSYIDVHIPYFWSGGHFHSYYGYNDSGNNFMGVPNKWGCDVKMAYGGTDVQQDGVAYPFGMDCSGFVVWSIYNGGYYTGSESQQLRISTSSVPSSIGGISVSSVTFKNSKGQVKPGDIAYKSGHVGLVVEVSGNKIKIAEEKGYKDGLVITEHSYSSKSFSHIVLMDNFYNNYQKDKPLWEGFK